MSVTNLYVDDILYSNVSCRIICKIPKSILTLPSYLQGHDEKEIMSNCLLCNDTTTGY